MNYILTQKELDTFISKEKYDKVLKINKYLEEIVLKQAKFKCIKTGETAYCDYCPLSFVKNRNLPQDIQYYLCSEEDKHFSK